MFSEMWHVSRANCSWRTGIKRCVLGQDCKHWPGAAGKCHHQQACSRAGGGALHPIAVGVLVHTQHAHTHKQTNKQTSKPQPCCFAGVQGRHLQPASCQPALLLAGAVQQLLHHGHAGCVAVPLCQAVQAQVRAGSYANISPWLHAMQVLMCFCLSAPHISAMCVCASIAHARTHKHTPSYYVHSGCSCTIMKITWSEPDLTKHWRPLQL